MPILEDSIPVTEISLPTSKGKVKVAHELDLEGSEAVYGTEGNFPRSVMTILKVIRSWDLQAKDGSPLPITLENVRKLPTSDSSAIMDFVTANMTKKDSKTPVEQEPTEELDSVNE